MSIVASAMFSFQKADAMEVRIVGMSESVMLGVNKDPDANTFYFKAAKRNWQLRGLLDKSIGEKRYYSRNASCTTVMKDIKKVRDEKYKQLCEQVRHGKKSKAFKTFRLRLPESVVIKAPAVGDVPSIDMRVLFGNLVYVKSVF